MQLSGVFCLKPGEICVLISLPLVPSSKIVTFFGFKLVASFWLRHKVQVVFLHSFISEEALGKFLLFLFYEFRIQFN